ncbi:MarR family winged helix-turn-helix transcriptional regulator [Gordonia hydrophobica]|uniref:MarR family transcriptional regulator n=1 Tax=Gordonia hydrophobica TaxID=40516 RepID=A0ABZ2U822_9ACTN|nr:MarR family transcriptional regulator [Gordonia hydrophobica]MBM7368239.1 DNA-binding MarR family transcriptional regulator [Gordonia hydrophobica]
MNDRQRELWQQFVGGGWVLYRAVFREIDQSSADWRLLEVLSYGAQMRISDLAEATQIGLSTVSRQVSRFLDRGFVERVDSDDVDARQKWVRITDVGRQEVAPILEARDRAVRRLIIDRLSAVEFEQLCGLFGTLGQRIAEDEG